MITRLRGVATWRIWDASSISAMKVDTPLVSESPAPTRASTESKSGKVADSHGTRLPACAMTARAARPRM